MKSYTSKRFLNNDGCHSDASIYTAFSFHYEKSASHDGEIKIRDCREYITLRVGVEDEFNSEGIPNENSYKNSIDKIDNIIQELTIMKSVMFVMRSEYKRRRKKIDDEKKQANVPGDEGTTAPSGGDVSAS
jgi:hypothetical protein